MSSIFLKIWENIFFIFCVKMLDKIIEMWYNGVKRKPAVVGAPQKIKPLVFTKGLSVKIGGDLMCNLLREVRGGEWTCTTRTLIVSHHS